MIHVSGTAVPSLARTNSQEPEFFHKPNNKEQLWMDNPRWAQDNFITRGFQSHESLHPLKGIHSELQSLNRRWGILTVEEVLTYLENGLLPNPSVEHIACVLHRCAEERDSSYASRLHAFIEKCRLDAHPSLANQLILMLVECGSIHQALQVFNKLTNWDGISFDLLITALIRHGKPLQALILYGKMKDINYLHLESHTYVALLKVCGEFKYLEQGHNVHTDVSSKGLLKTDTVIGNTLVSMYAKCSALAKAQEVFDDLPVRNVVSWNALIAGYAKQGHGVEALDCFERMQHDGVSPNAVTYICSLKACCSIGDTVKGREIHAEIARQGLLETDIRVGSTLLDMYAKCGQLAKAQEVFTALPNRNIIAWNTLIAGYAEHGHGVEAIDSLEQMQFEGVSPDAFTFACGLKACGSIRAIDKGLELHAKVSKNGLLEKDYMVASALIDMYSKCGLLTKAQEAFDRLPIRDVVSWTSLIAGYAEHGPGEKALTCFEEMQREGISPNAVTFLCSLKACSCLGAIAKGVEIHSMIAKEGMLERDLLVGSTLVDMYAKCGSLAKAQEVFDKLLARDLVSWNALLAGYAQIGRNKDVFLCYDKMIQEGIKPNVVTFIIVLNACNHLGLVDKGLDYCEAMTEDYSIAPTVEHLACMVDLLGRSGQLEKVVATINKLPVCPDGVVWLTVLSACRKWRNVDLGRWAFEQAVQIDCKDPSAYICMGIIYADAGMQEDANKVEAMRVENQAWNKSEHCSWRDGMGVLRTFTIGGRHLLGVDVYTKLEELSHKMSERGCNSGFPQGFMDMTKSDWFCGHNERLAVASALLNTPKGTPIHITKNVRVCNDCHAAMALISEIEQCKITVDDTSRHHVFEGGRCTCKDYW